VLARLKDQREAVARIVGRIAQASPARRGVALRQLAILAGLRDLEDLVRQEVKKVPVLDSILDNKILGPPYKRGLKQGLEEGLEKGLKKGREEGKLEGERLVLMRQIEKRFGTIPAATRRRLDRLTTAQMEEAALRLLDAARLDEIFG